MVSLANMESFNRKEGGIAQLAKEHFPVQAALEALRIIIFGVDAIAGCPRVFPFEQPEKG